MVGLAGLVGAGRTELARCLFGVDPFDQGEIEVAGEPRRIRSIQDALKAGIALAVEDRKRQGLVLSMSVRHNVTLASLEKISRCGCARRNKKSCRNRLGLAVKTPHIDQLVGNLSGGNQQKVVLAKWLAKQFDVLILDEPTIGIDVGSRWNSMNSSTIWLNLAWGFCHLLRPAGSIGHERSDPGNARVP